MTTVAELAQDLLGSINTDATPIITAKWIDNRYKEMVSRVRFRHLRAVGELSLEAVVDDGTVSVTRGSTSVTGDGTTFVTDISSGDQEYYYFRTRTAWYKIASIEGEEALTLASNFAEADVSDGSYDIVRRHYALASDARWVGDFWQTRLRRTLESNIPVEFLNLVAPGRPIVNNIPHYAIQIGVDSNGYLMYEIYPPAKDSQLIHYIYWKLPTALAITSNLPSVIDPYTLKEGVLIDLYRYEKSHELRRGNVEQAAVWRNDEKAQAAIWEKMIREAIRTSRGADDLTLILEMFPGSARMHDQRTARDYVYDNWSR